MLRAYKYRIYPTNGQQNQIDKTFGCCRLVYNLALETKIYAFRSQGKNLSEFDLTYQLPHLKDYCPWLKEVNSQSLIACVNILNKAFNSFFKGHGFPKYKSKTGGQSFQCPNNTRRIDWNAGTLTIPKIKNIPIVLSRKFEGKIKTVTISKTSTGKYFASILVEDQIQVPEKRPIAPETTLGIDLGIKDFAITSEGVKYENPKYLRNALDRLKVLQYRASKKKKGGANRRKANKRVAILHERITNKRLDFIHKLTSGLVNDNQVDTFILEDLNVKGMISNHKLAQSISDVSWGKFREILSYKCEWAGKNLIFIDRFAPSSKTCSCCGNVKKLFLADRIYECNACGYVIDRDVNAAVNIKNFGLNSGPRKPVEPVEQPGLYGAEKQETH